RDYFLLLLLTGLRKHEAACLRWADINFKSKKLTARNTKNRRDHTLPMTDYIHSLLKNRQDEQKKAGKPSDYVFDGSGKHGRIVDVRHYQQKIIKKSQVEFTPHALRRTFSYATARVRLGDSERKALLNHLGKTDVTDAHYTPWQIEDLREPLKLVETYILDHSQKPSRSSDDLSSATNVVRLTVR
ncbi:MAG: tyrosine-type recombinase/integrase, partial [Candidatus Obscuribacterales bacterium]|nr:tyrosine-type recombinase/integrase [Candidatus Obscuribacterales bacterium]